MLVFPEKYGKLGKLIRTETGAIVGFKRSKDAPMMSFDDPKKAVEYAAKKN